ncbi:DNA repair protein RecO [Psychromonas sp. CNPT3]|uniref:DNA repair protein RecO n=1 Tax=Psychromonas sp. CNPT3 TaxID=314282 RepID=UPI00006E8AAD|nr:DNA repair protein RecO [Psychromonas sp. CNPT3]AGH80529.1 DNA repair protein RecO [Psychromonas sp. CNPT3]
MSIECHNAFILHRRPYRETSLLLDLFCQDIGKVSLIYKGGRSSTRLRRGCAQPFTLLQATYFGRSSLKTVKSIEAKTQVVPLVGERLYMAMYVNELLYRLLQAETACDGLFSCYQDTLLALAGAKDNQHAQIALRNFELTLLESLGYGVNFTQDIYSDELIEPGFDYQYLQQQGFFAKQAIHQKQHVYSGLQIQALAERNFSNAEFLSPAKRFCRQALAHLLGNKPLHSRRLFKTTEGIK